MLGANSCSASTSAPTAAAAAAHRHARDQNHLTPQRGGSVYLEALESCARRETRSRSKLIMSFLSKKDQGVERAKHGTAKGFDKVLHAVARPPPPSKNRKKNIKYQKKGSGPRGGLGPLGYQLRPERTDKAKVLPASTPKGTDDDGTPIIHTHARSPCGGSPDDTATARAES